MKRILALTLALTLSVLPVSSAQDEAPAAVKKAAKSKKKEMAAVPELLSKATYLTRKKPNLKAKYYGFLRSASWCVPCKMFVPKLLKDYGKMKGARMELIFLGQEDEAAVKQYMKEGDIDIPGVMPAELGSIPGVQFPNLGVPSLCIVDADGNFVGASGGVNMYEWKKQLQAFKKEQTRLKAQKKKAASEHDEPESAR